MEPLATGGLDKGQVELQVMAYLFYVRTYGELAQVLERGASFPGQVPEVSHINPP